MYGRSHSTGFGVTFLLNRIMSLLGLGHCPRETTCETIDQCSQFNRCSADQEHEVFRGLLALGTALADYVLPAPWKAKDADVKKILSLAVKSQTRLIRTYGNSEEVLERLSCECE